jgi:peptide/nickel transport system permease protein
MAQFVVRRLIQFIPVMILVSIVVFLMVRMIPGDPAAALLGPNAKPEQVEAMRAQMGLDEPIWVQYFVWVSRMLGGDFGKSFINDFPVSKLILRKLPATVQLAVAALIVALLISIPLGIMSSLRRGHWPDHIATVYNSLAMGIPNFWLGILFVLIFALKLKVLPPSGYVSLAEEPVAGLKFLILPALTLGIYISAILARFIKSSILETLNQEYVRTAHSKGLPSRLVVSRHILKNALIPLVTVFGLQFGGLLGGAVITEYIFDWPGLGNLLVHSILTRDYSIVQAVTILAVTVYLVVNLGTDLLYGLIDPRIRRK